MTGESMIPARKRRIFAALLTAVCLMVVFLAYCLSVLVRSAGLYDDVKVKQDRPMANIARFAGKAVEFDSEQGHVLAPRGEGVFFIPQGSPVPFHHDDEGRRAPLGVAHAFQGERHPRMLFLGDSFTYGQLVAAENAFASRAAAILGGEAINGGVFGYGLAQMVLQARKLVPRYRPDYIVVQYSPWLVTRSMTGFTPDTAMVMAPYYFESAEGAAVFPVPFTPPSFVLDRLDKYKGSPPGLLDRTAFFVTFALPHFLYRDMNLGYFRLKQWLGLTPQPSDQPEKVVRAAYGELAELARQNNAQMVVVALGTSEPLAVPGEFLPAGTPGVNAWQLLVSRLPVATSDEYVRHYFHWRGNPPQPVDWHPNERAHALIAEGIAERISMLEAQKKGMPQKKL